MTGAMRIVREEGDEAPPRMKLLIHAAAPVKVQVDGYDGHPRLRATTRAVKPEFIALLLPMTPEVGDPRVVVEEKSGSLRIQLQWPARTDEVVWPRQGERRPLVTLRAGPT